MSNLNDSVNLQLDVKYYQESPSHWLKDENKDTFVPITSSDFRSRPVYLGSAVGSYFTEESF